MNEEGERTDVHTSTYFGIYEGIVVQNNDPEMRGRVKIFVPEHSPTVFSLNEDTKKGVILKFKNIHQKASPEISTAIEAIRSALPWAEQAAPLMGGVSSGMYNHKTKTATNQDAGFNPEEGEPGTPADIVYPAMATDNPIRTATEESKPEAYRGPNNFVGYRMEEDPFGKTKENGNHFVNPLYKEYQPSNYSGMARGFFSIPNVGANVYLFYRQGDPMNPVYFAASFGQSDFRRIYTMSEDDKTTNATDYPLAYENNTDGDTGRFRSKAVFNTNKHSVEFVDTDDHESIKINAFNGSFKEFSNDATIELATGNDQKMVMGDQFETVSGNKSSYVDYDQEDITNGNKYVTTGVQPKEVVDEIIRHYKQQHVYKRLFPTRHTDPSLTPKECSPLESRAGSFDICPICGHPSMEYMNDPSPEMPEMVLQPMCHDDSVPLPPSPPPMTSPGIFANTPCPSCLNKEWSKTPWYTGNAGLSPSTANGFWANTDFSPLISMIRRDATEITRLEKLLGRGGDEIHKVTMSKMEMIGQSMNDMESTRTDPIGRLVYDGCHVAMNGCTPYYLPAPLVQYVDVADIPGGDYIITAMNKYKLTVGSRGISIQTTGPVDMCGSIFNIASQELNLIGKDSLNLEGGELINLRARKIVVSPKGKNALMIDGQLHCDRNLIVCGGAYFEGEVGIQHITCPLEWHTTWTTCWDMAPFCEVACIYILPFITCPGKIILPRHEHWFESIPTTFTTDSAQTRMRMRNKGINSRDHIVKADKVIYEPKLPTCGFAMRPMYQFPNAYTTEKLPDNKLNCGVAKILDCNTTTPEEKSQEPPKTELEGKPPICIWNGSIQEAQLMGDYGKPGWEEKYSHAPWLDDKGNLKPNWQEICTAYHAEQERRNPAVRQYAINHNINLT